MGTDHHRHRPPHLAVGGGIAALTGEDSLAFFDAIAHRPHDSVDLTKAWFQSRYDKSDPDGDGADYMVPFGSSTAFIEALLTGDKIDFKDWKKTPLFRGLHAGG